MFDVKAFQNAEKYFLKEHDHSYELLDGQGPIMLSAPHSVEQTRKGRIKRAEPQTGALAKMLHEELGCPVIYKTKNCGDDANFDEHSSYKEALVSYIKQKKILFLLDLHQLAAYRDVIIDIGTGRLKNVGKMEYVNVALAAFSKRNLGLIQIDQPFDSTNPFTISSYITKQCGISCLQIEINSKAVYSESGVSEAEQVFEALREIVINLSKIFSGQLL